MDERKLELFDWFFEKEKKFTVQEIDLLIIEIKKFNAGAIDEYLSNHVEKVFAKWLEDQKEK